MHVKFIQVYFIFDDLVDGVDGSVDGAVACGAGFFLFAVHAQPDGSHGAQRISANHLQQGYFDGVIVVCFCIAVAHEFQQVGVIDFFFGIGHQQEALVHFIHVHFFHVVAQALQVVLQGVAAAARSEYDGVGIDPYIFGVQDLVVFAVLQHAVLVDTGAVREGIAAHNGFVGLHRHMHHGFHEGADLVDAFGIDVGAISQRMVRFQDHSHFFEGSVPGAFADAVDSALHLAGAVHYAGNGVGGSQPEVVMAMHGDDGLVDVGHVIHQVLDLCAVLIRQAITVGIGDINGGGAGGNDGFHHAGQVFIVCAAGIFRIKFHIIHKLTGILHGSHRAL